ncbi:hypothetical protein [Microbacterium binotii]|uniref:hypothetical protein n=1 Tax=Microbacterium binotii TaxID=462710 RepID=UPI001F1B4027|nr:hypothetical protein [Microbacterium binotii]UIN31280.1 hypothetical protein LXM64_03490 [Microbacterium binotii]
MDVTRLLDPLGMGVAFGLMCVLVALVMRAVVEQVRRARASRRARMERELDRRQRQLRATIFSLASALADESIAADDTKRKIARAVYIARGDLPK